MGNCVRSKLPKHGRGGRAPLPDPAGREDNVPERPDPGRRESTPGPLIEGILKTVNVDLNAESNRDAHHTDEYEVHNLVVRRGQAFDIIVTYDREIDDETDEVKFIFHIGDNPKVSKGTEVHVTPGCKSLTNTEWGAQRVGESGNDVTYKLMTPANAIVDEWSMIVQTLFDHKNEKTNRYRYKVKESIYVLFNAWCKEDTVYMVSEEERHEYVLEQIGLIWLGSAANTPLRWNYKQFDDVCLDGSLWLLKKSGLPAQARSNAVLCCRVLAQMANSSDDGGVMTGNWSGNFADGTSPTIWRGSGSIMEQYMRTKSPVKYAQCWVFSGLLTTLCRAIGIPTRSVTNFDSAHDTDCSMTIDMAHYDSETGEPVGGHKNDSVWNFHVWNESYMKRPDLPEGYDGWQAHDSTPQELSEDLWRCGPAPVAAIKNGDVHINYDSKFIFAEVNGDRVYWTVEKDGNMIASQIETDTVGKEISTKAVGRMARNDVTHEYKYDEGSDAERAAVARAMNYSTRRKYIKIDESTNDCAMTLEVKTGRNADILAVIRVTNNSNEERNVKLNIQAVAAYYTGMTGEDLKKASKNLTIDANGNVEYEMKIPAVEWISTVDDDATVKVFVTGRVTETGQMMAKQKAAAVDKPDLEVKATPKSVSAGEEFEVTASFTNPLEIPVTKGVFTLEGPGAQRSFDVEAKKSIAPGETVTGKAKFIPRFAGTKEVVVGFSSRQLTGITGAVSIVVKKKYM